jgi:hypothetical protein
METLNDIKRNYLIGNKLFLKKKINIECAIFSDLGGYSNTHTWVELVDSIDIISIGSGSFIFKSMDKAFIYWCDVNIFTKLKCKDIYDVREDMLTEILKNK